MDNAAILFPGQGSQYVGMARDFLETSAEARHLFDRAEEISGLPIKKLCLEGPMADLTRTLHLQPAVTAVNLVCWQALRRTGLAARFVAGHSLGEYSALCAAGVLDVDDTLRLVSERGRLMEREAAANPGAMAAVLGLPMEQVEAIIAAVEEGVVTVANFNTPQQIVISGSKEGVRKASAMVKEQGGKPVPLKVSGAWHSPLIAGAIEDFTAFMADIPFHRPDIPVLLNVTGRPEEDPATIRKQLARQVAAMVRWVDIIEYLVDQDVRTFIEVGPKSVLSGLVKKTISADYDCRILQVDTPEKIAALDL